MFRHPFFVFLFFLLIAIAILHILGLTFSLYWRLSLLDIFVHFLGGLWIGGALLWFVFLSGLISEELKKKAWLHVYGFSLGIALVVGIGWEIFELAIFGPLLYADMESYILDTVLDLFADLSGALAITWYFLRKNLENQGAKRL